MGQEALKSEQLIVKIMNVYDLFPNVVVRCIDIYAEHRSQRLVLKAVTIPTSASRQGRKSFKTQFGSEFHIHVS